MSDYDVYLLSKLFQIFHMTVPGFSMPSNSFYSELRKRVHEYFQLNNISTTGNIKLYLKGIIATVLFTTTYIHLIFFTPGYWLAALECVFLGGLTAFIGFNIMHDGAHGSFSKRRWLNALAGASINFLGANVHLWKTKHNYIHHTFTNIDGIDDDIDGKPFLRLAETQPKYKIHRIQHWYFLIVYSLLYFFWIFFTDYKKYLSNKIGSMPGPKYKVIDHILFWGFKAIHIFLFILLPIYKVGFLPWLVGFTIYGLFTGIALSLVFQLAHTIAETKFPQPVMPGNKIEDEWAILQLKTTANFSTKNKILSWLVGGLNFQIEHHLFPLISHVHYPKISPIVKQTCLEFNVPYIEHPNMRSAIRSHIKHLRHLARN